MSLLSYRGFLQPRQMQQQLVKATACKPNILIKTRFKCLHPAELLCHHISFKDETYVAVLFTIFYVKRNNSEAQKLKLHVRW